MAFAGFNVFLALRAVQMLFTIIVLATAAYVCAFFDDDTIFDSPSEARFMTFTAVWTLLILIVILAVMPRISLGAGPMILLGLDALTMLFWFAAWIALAAWTDDHCYSGNVCRTSGAATAFGAFTWVLFAATTGLLVMEFLKNRKSGVTSHTPTTATHEPATHEPATTATPSAKTDDIAV